MSQKLIQYMRLATLMALASCGGGGGSAPITAPTTTPPVVGTTAAHPRLWLSDAGTMDRLKASVQNNTTEWIRLKSYCDNQTEPDYDYQGSQPARQIEAFALCYRTVKATAGDAEAAPYANKAIALLRDNTKYPFLSFTQYSTDSGYGIRNYVPAMAIAYDWLYDYPGMDRALKDLIVLRINAWLSWFETSGYGRSDNISNYNAGYMSARVLSAIALKGEEGQPPEAWNKAIAHIGGALQEFDQKMPGGHWPEGWNYGANVYQQYLWAASALKIATNDSQYLNSLWLTNNVTMKMNAITPDGKFFYDDGSWSGNGYGYPPLNDMTLAGYAYGWTSEQGKIARSYLDLAAKGSGNTNYTLVEGEWKSFLFFDPNSLPINLDTLPKSYLAKGTGLVTMRSDWAEPQGTWASFIAGPYLSYQGSQDKDQGHIELYKGAPLLIDASHNFYGDKGLNGLTYTKNTILQNTYTLRNRSDTPPNQPYDGQNITPLNCQNGSNGNPIRNNAYSEATDYSFSSGEFSAAYQIVPIYPAECGTNVVNWLNRSVLFLRPNLYIVYDQVEKSTSQTAVVPVMNLHFPTAPTAQNASNRQLSLDSNGARLQMVTVLPAASTSTVLAEIKDANTGPGVSNWHLSVSYADPSPAYQKFLTVMRAGLANASYSFPAVSAITGSNVSGSLISGLLASESATPIAVVFAESGNRSVPTSLSFSYTADPLTKNYIAKLKPNTTYLVNRSSASGVVSVTVSEGVSNTKTDTAGVLVF